MMYGQYTSTFGFRDSSSSFSGNISQPTSSTRSGNRQSSRLGKVRSNLKPVRVVVKSFPSNDVCDEDVCYDNVFEEESNSEIQGDGSHHDVNLTGISSEGKCDVFVNDQYLGNDFSREKVDGLKLSKFSSSGTENTEAEHFQNERLCEKQLNSSKKKGVLNLGNKNNIVKIKSITGIQQKVFDKISVINLDRKDIVSKSNTPLKRVVLNSLSTLEFSFNSKISHSAKTNVCLHSEIELGEPVEEENDPIKRAFYPSNGCSKQNSKALPVESSLLDEVCPWKRSDAALDWYQGAAMKDNNFKDIKKATSEINMEVTGKCMKQNESHSAIKRINDENKPLVSYSKIISNKSKGTPTPNKKSLENVLTRSTFNTGGCVTANDKENRPIEKSNVLEHILCADEAKNNIHVQVKSNQLCINEGDNYLHKCSSDSMRLVKSDEELECKKVSDIKSKIRMPKVLMINKKQYLMLGLIGRGGSSKVYQVFDDEREILLAAKCVDLSAVDSATAEGYINEIQLLSRLQFSDRVIRLYEHEYLENSRKLYVVMERGDTDLATMLRKTSKTNQITGAMILYYWTEMLNAVKVIHQEGIIHSDLKPANFLLVSGRLKLIDFGIASSLMNDSTSIIKETQTGTCNYMSPEAVQDTSQPSCTNAGVAEKPRIKIGVKSDVWSLGCILYNLVYHKTPFQHIPNPWNKLQAITNPNFHIDYPPTENTLAVDVMKKCLVRDPKQRPSIDELLEHPYVSNANGVCVY